MVQFFGWDSCGLPLRDPDKAPSKESPSADLPLAPPLAGAAGQRSYDLIVTLILGLVSKARVDRVEASLLDRWCADNAIHPHEWPAGVIACRLSRCLSGEALSAAEISDLTALLEDIAGAAVPAHAAPAPIPFSSPAPEILFPRKEFVLAGHFLSGAAICQEDLWQQGASCSPSVTRQLDYLVIGAIRSWDWARGPVGDAIRQAQALPARRSGGPAIISEEDLLKALYLRQHTLHKRRAAQAGA